MVISLCPPLHSLQIAFLCWGPLRCKPCLWSEDEWGEAKEGRMKYWQSEKNERPSESYNVANVDKKKKGVCIWLRNHARFSSLPRLSHSYISLTRKEARVMTSLCSTKLTLLPHVKALCTVSIMMNGRATPSPLPSHLLMFSVDFDELFSSYILHSCVRKLHLAFKFEEWFM